MPEQPIATPEEGKVSLYVYEADMFRDAFEVISEYMGEAEHAGFDGFDVPVGTKNREKIGKMVLWRDLGTYFIEKAEQLKEEEHLGDW